MLAAAIVLFTTFVSYLYHSNRDSRDTRPASQTTPGSGLETGSGNADKTIPLHVSNPVPATPTPDSPLAATPSGIAGRPGDAAAAGSPPGSVPAGTEGAPGSAAFSGGENAAAGPGVVSPSSGESTEEEDKSPITLSGVIMDEKGGPVGNCRVEIMPEGFGAVPFAVTSQSDGSYLFGRVYAGSMSVRVLPPADSPFAIPEPRTIFLTQEKKNERADFVLAEGDVISGIVVNEQGGPVAGSAVSAANGIHSRTVLTGEDGAFSIGGLQPGQAFQSLTVSHPDYQTATLDNISMLDGFQKIILKRSNTVSLTVHWTWDDTPVEFFSWKLLRKIEFREGYNDAEKAGTVLDNPEGRADLGNLESGSWMVEVCVLSPESAPTEIRGSAAFTLETGETQREVAVGIDTGRRARGTVCLMDLEIGEILEKLEGVKVSIVPPSAGFGRFPPPDKAFHLEPVITDAEGAFVFEGLPPGHFTLQAELESYESFVTPGAVDLVVPFEADPEPLEIRVIKGGRIHGSVIGEDGNPLAGTSIQLSLQRADADGWGGKSVNTDAEGTYEFKGLPAGVHYIWVTMPSEQDSQRVDLAAGEEKEVNFNFSGMVSLSGKILLNDSPPSQNGSFRFIGENDARGKSFPIGPDGHYTALVKPGRHIIDLLGGSPPSGQMEPVEILAEPNVQARDFLLNSESADIILIFPPNVEFEQGQIVLSPPERFQRYSFHRVKAHQPERHVVSLYANKYLATFHSQSGRRHAQSGWVALGPGGNNTFVLEIRDARRGVRVGGWTPGLLSPTEFRPLPMDVTPHIKGPGMVEVLVCFESGRHAVEPAGVVLLVNGQPAARDDHHGWTGADHWNNAYRIPVGTPEPGSRYEIEVRLRSDGGTDSAGSIYWNAD